MKLKGVPWHSAFADDSTVQQAVEEAGDEDFRLSLSQLANNRQERSARCTIPEDQTQSSLHGRCVFIIKHISSVSASFRPTVVKCS